MPYTVPVGNNAAIDFASAYTPPAGNVVPLPFGDGYPTPIAVPDSYAAAASTPLSVAAPGVLSNDTLNSAIASLATSPAHGSLSFNPNGSFTYTPTTGYTGFDTFSYTLTNIWGTSTAVVTIAIASPAPIAVDDSFGMAYGATLSVPAPGVLGNDTVNGGSPAVATNVSHGILTFNTDGSFSYAPTLGYFGADSFTYTLSSVAGSSTATVSLTVGSPPAQRYNFTERRLPWTTAAKRMRSLGSGWARAPRVHIEPALAWSHAGVVHRAIALTWAAVPRVRVECNLPWSQAPQIHPRSIGVAWAHVPRVQISTALPWGLPPARYHSAGIAWREPAPHLLSTGLPWSIPPFGQHSAGLGFSLPPSRERRWWLPWGHAKPVRWVVHSPGVDPPDDPPDGSYVPPLGNRVAINFACPQLVFDGAHVPVPFGPAACYFAWPKPKVYIVENSANVVRLPERSPISVTSIDLQQGIDDVHWSMRMSLGDPAALELLKADVDGPKVVEITMNGFVWTAIVENYQQDRRHPTRTVSVSGRSQTALLDTPYAPLRSKVEPADKLTQQLIDDELALTDFTADYSAVSAQTGIGGWLVPGGVWHYDSQSAIAATRTVAGASGAVVQAHPWDKMLVVTPRYPFSPWDWALTAPDKQIQDDIILSDSLRLVSKPLYDYVLVSGEQAGVSDPIIRTGELGATRAPMVVDALMTDHLATRERGRNILCDRGEQAQVDITIPLYPLSNPSQPGLVLPLQLVQVIELASWKALATAVSISAKVQDQNGVGVLVIEQTVTLERHYSDAE